MNLKRIIAGPILSFVFLIIFVYMISGVKWFFDSSVRIESGDELLASISTSFYTASIVSVPIQDNFQPVFEVAPMSQINANAAISVECNLKGANKIIFEKDSDTQLPIASLTKLMTAIVVLENYDLSDIVVVSEAANLQDSMKQDVNLGDSMSVESFLEIMLVGSSNKSAYALAEKMNKTVFVGAMNKKAKDLGLQKTFFVDPTGLSPENVSTAKDLAKLAEYILKNYLKIAEISKLKEVNIPGFGKVINTDQLLGEIPEVICSKTGFTEAANGCLLLVVNNSKNNNYLINVILGSDNRFAEMRKLIETCK